MKLALLLILALCTQVPGQELLGLDLGGLLGGVTGLVGNLLQPVINLLKGLLGGGDKETGVVLPGPILSCVSSVTVSSNDCLYDITSIESKIVLEITTIITVNLDGKGLLSSKKNPLITQITRALSGALKKISTALSDLTKDLLDSLKSLSDKLHNNLSKLLQILNSLPSKSSQLISVINSLGGFMSNVVATLGELTRRVRNMDVSEIEENLLKCVPGFVAEELKAHDCKAGLISRFKGHVKGGIGEIVAVVKKLREAVKKRLLGLDAAMKGIFSKLMKEPKVAGLVG